MLFVRKSYILPTAFLLSLIYLLFSSLPPAPEALDIDDREFSPPPKQNGGQIHWQKGREKHPIKSYIPLPTAAAPLPIPKIQHDFPSESWYRRRQRVNRQTAVKQAFEHAWKGYKKHAWLHDELSPLSGDNRETFAGWAATLVDSLDSLIIMGMTDEFEKALAALEQIDFTTTDATQINVFETTIRYLGGFMAANDLTDGKYPILLKKAVEVGEFLYSAFDTRNRMPQSRWQWTRTAEGLGIEPSRNTILAELGSLTLEFTRLSQLTNDSKYFDAIQRITDQMEAAQQKTKVPGLWPVMVNAEEMKFTDPRFTVGGMADSMYEYLPKEYMLLSAQVNQYKSMYDSAMDAIKDRLIFRGMTKDNQEVLFAGNAQAGMPSKEDLEHEAEHLKCFLGGMVGIGAKVFRRSAEELRIARGLTDGCIWAYDSMPTGIMPEIFHVSACDDMDDCKWDEKKWYRDVQRRLSKGTSAQNAQQEGKSLVKTHGLAPGMTDISDARYFLRPEAIESVFIMYRITGDKTLQDAAWRMFKNIEKITRTDYAHAAIYDVRDRHTPKLDYMESFWLAETLKYFYLIFSEPTLVSLDEYVL
ncbi:hydrolase family 47 protein [Aspergillus sclerotialis]|uniref:alpha-1,2-Mannosidase n=1 Tax=Aspergillus sclerotialis TaxID=2070753 RepID=A0A3A3A7Z4_9EURO|nr:hydrolase family 47 protein [Aspergillus sclerotialis]